MIDNNYSLGDDFVDATENFLDVLSNGFDVVRYFTTFSRAEIEQFQSYQDTIRSILRGINELIDAAEQRQAASSNVIQLRPKEGT